MPLKLLPDSEMHPFLSAALTGDLATINQYCQDKQFDINLLSIRGQTALHFAAENSHEKIIEALCQHDININHQDNSKRTALHIAASNGHNGIIQILNQYGADFSLRDSKEMTALLCSADSNEFFTTSHMLNNYQVDPLDQDSYGYTILHTAVNNENLDVIKDLVVNYTELVNLADNYGSTPLHYAAENDATDVISVLIENGADIYQQDGEGNNPFHIAVFNQNMDALNKLLSLGMNINMVNNDGQSALHIAALEGDKYIIEFLLLNNIDHKIKDNDGRTALHIAATAITIEALELAQQKDKSLKTLASDIKKQAKIIRTLLHSLANNESALNDEDKYGNTPRQLAAEYSHDLKLTEQLSHGLKDNKWEYFIIGMIKSDDESLFLRTLEMDNPARADFVSYSLENVICKKIYADAVLRAAIGIMAWTNLEKLYNLQVTKDVAISMSEIYVFSKPVLQYLKKHHVKCNDETDDTFGTLVIEKTKQITQWIVQQKRLHDTSYVTSIEQPISISLYNERNVKIRRLNSLARLLALHPSIKTWRCVAVSVAFDQETRQQYFNLAVNDPGKTRAALEKTIAELHGMIKSIFDSANNLKYFNDDPEAAIDNLLDVEFLHLTKKRAAQEQAIKNLATNKDNLTQKIASLADSINVPETQKIPNRSRQLEKSLNKYKADLQKLEADVKTTTKDYDNACQKQPRARRDLIKVILSIRGKHDVLDKHKLITDSQHNYLFESCSSLVLPENTRLIQTDVQRHCEQEIARREIILLQINNAINNFIQSSEHSSELCTTKQKIIDIIAAHIALLCENSENSENNEDVDDDDFIHKISKEMLKHEDIIHSLRKQAENNNILIGVSYKCCPRCTEELKSCSIPVQASHDIICPTKGLFDEFLTQVPVGAPNPRGSVQSPSASHYSAELLCYYSSKRSVTTRSEPGSIQNGITRLL